jgi:hypothetical protein
MAKYAESRPIDRNKYTRRCDEAVSRIHSNISTLLSMAE